MSILLWELTVPILLITLFPHPLEKLFLTKLEMRRLAWQRLVKLLDFKIQLGFGSRYERPKSCHKAKQIKNLRTHLLNISYECAIHCISQAKHLASLIWSRVYTFLNTEPTLFFFLHNKEDIPKVFWGFFSPNLLAEVIQVLEKTTKSRVIILTVRIVLLLQEPVE